MEQIFARNIATGRYATPAGSGRAARVTIAPDVAASADDDDAVMAAGVLTQLLPLSPPSQPPVVASPVVPPRTALAPLVSPSLTINSKRARQTPATKAGEEVARA